MQICKPITCPMEIVYMLVNGGIVCAVSVANIAIFCRKMVVNGLTV